MGERTNSDEGGWVTLPRNLVGPPLSEDQRAV